MIVQTEAIVIHSLRYGENDLIVSLLTKKSGLKSYLLKGVLKSKRAKIRASLFQPLSLLEIEAAHKNKGNLERIREAKLLVPYTSLHTDIHKSAIVFFLSEVLHHAIKEEAVVDTALFEFLQSAFIWLDTHNEIGNFHIVFLIRLTQYLGFYPDISSLSFPYFNMLEGCFQVVDSNRYCVMGVHIEQLKAFLGTTFDYSIQISLSRSIRKDILDAILVYFELHLHSFKKPKSLSVLNEIFS